MSETPEKRGFTRRKFLTISAVGVGALFGTGFATRGLWRRWLAGYINTAEFPYPGSTEPGLWFEILADDSVVLHSPKVEMGQGTLTGLAQIAADELGVEFDRMRVVHAATSTGNVDTMGTGGSTSIQSLWTPLRETAATLRETIRQEGARRLGVDPSEAEIGDGVVRAGDRTIRWGEIASSGNTWTIADTPPLRPRSEHRYVGRPVARIDLSDKVFGAPIFGIDAEVPGMLHGAVVRPERIGARFISADGAAAAAMPGVVQVVIEDGFAGVVAESFTAAQRARDAIEVEWEVERSWSREDIESMIRIGEGTPHVIQKEGDVEAVFERGTVIEADYTTPIGAHAQLEPAVALADVADGQATVHVSTQVPAGTRSEVADFLGVKDESVDIRPTFLGGGFGRRLQTPIAVDAARLSRAAGRPVKVVHTRKQEFQRDTFRPPTHHRVRATLADDGSIEAIEHQVSSGDVMYGSPLVPAVAAAILGHDLGAWRGGMIQYRSIPNHRAVSWRVKLPFATSWWRSLGLLANTFAIESFLDEVAAEAGVDPVELRLRQIPDDERGFRLSEVIRTAAEQAGWRTDVVDGVAMGFAASTDVNVPCAHVAEVSVEDGRIRVHRVTCVMDPGLVVNPDLVRQQCEGSVVMGLSAAMYEEMTVTDGQLTPTIYGPYRMAALKDAPYEVDVHLLENADAPGGVGEPPLGPIGAAIANAVWRVTGVRLRSMPLQPALDRELA